MWLLLLLLPAAQVGLNYICATAERFFAVGAVLGSMVVLLAEQPSPRLLKHIIRCYLRLSDNPRCVLHNTQRRAQSSDARPPGWVLSDVCYSPDPPPPSLPLPPG